MPAASCSECRTACVLDEYRVIALLAVDHLRLTNLAEYYESSGVHAFRHIRAFQDEWVDKHNPAGFVSFGDSSRTPASLWSYRVSPNGGKEGRCEPSSNNQIVPICSGDRHFE